MNITVDINVPLVRMAGDSRTLAEQTFENIFNLILTGGLPLDAEINEANLAERFKVSRGPVREAVRRLQGLKLVTRAPYMRARVVSMSPQDVVEIFQLRGAVEGMACRLATERMTGAELSDLVADLDRSRKRRRGDSFDPMAAAEENFDLHARIAQSSGNKRIEHLLCNELYHLLRIYRYRSGSRPGRRDQAFEEHWQVAKAMQARDPDLAESLMRSHIARATESLQMADLPAPPAPSAVANGARTRDETRDARHAGPDGFGPTAPPTASRLRVEGGE